MAATRGSINKGIANGIGASLVSQLGGSGYAPNEWDSKINLLGIADADIEAALASITEATPSGEAKGSILLTKANSIGAMLNKKYKTSQGFKPNQWKSAIDQLTPLPVKTASGAIASFADGADDVPLSSASFGIVPYQNLNGYSKPWAAGCGKNMIDITTLIDGYVNANGTFNTNHPMGEMRSGFIKVKPNTQYYFSIVETTGTADAWVGIGQYTSNDISTFIKRSTYWAFTTEATCEYIVVSARNLASATKIQLEENATATTWEPYSNVCPIEARSGMTITHAHKNWLNVNGTDTTKGYILYYYLLNTGETCYNSEWSTSEYIEIKGNTQYTLSGITGGNPSICFYDANKNFLSGVKYGGANPKTVTSPSGAVYARVSFENASKDTWQMELGATATTFKPYIAPETYADTFGLLIYGGTRESDGTLSETYGRKEVDGTETSGDYLAGVNNNGNRVGFALSDAETPKYSGCLSNVLENKACLNSTTWTIGSFCVCGGKLYIVCPNEYDTYAKCINYLISIGAEIVYPLATPVEHEIEPLPVINSFYGDNNFYTDVEGGTNSIDYRADIDLAT